MRAMSLIEETLEKPLAKIDMEAMSIKDLCVFIWAGLYHEDNSLTVESVMDLVDEYSDIGTVSEILGKAITNSFGADGKKQIAKK